jgi:hypothetical protein
LVFASGSSPYTSLQIWHNDGRGHFNDRETIVMPSFTAYAVLDVEGYGRPSFVYAAAGPDSGLWVMRVQPRGSFDPAESLAPGIVTDRLVVADLDGDHHPDLLAAPARPGSPSHVVLMRGHRNPIVLDGSDLRPRDPRHDDRGLESGRSNGCGVPRQLHG